MADRGDTHYHVPHLNAWFAISSILLLISAVWMVIDDWNRPWKAYQREFRALEIERGEAELAAAEAQAALAEAERLEGVLAERREDLDRRRDEIVAAEEELRQLEGKQFTTTEAAKKAKQVYNFEKWEIEEYRIHHGDPDHRAEDLVELEQRLYLLEGEKQAADLAVAEQARKLEEMRSSVIEIENAIKAATKDVDLVRKKMASIDPEDLPTQVANIVRDFPGLDFIGPSLVVNKIVLEDLTFELNFTKKKRIDMCTTCHLPIDREGYEEEEHPHKSHPRLDLFLSAKSPHPMNEVGCTICHRGSGEALDFVRADHRPSTDAEGDEWYEAYHWHKKHYWDYPMLSSEYIEASCVQCHTDSMELIADEAPKVAEGYRLFEENGCYACHKVEWFPTKRRPGPSLKGIRQKTDKEWVDSWIAGPRDFRPTTRMPQIFHLENYGVEDVVVVSEYGTGREMLGQEWSDAAVAAVAAFVWDSASDEAPPEIPVEGDPKRGREVFRLSGCLACHNLAPYETPEQEPFDPALRRRGTNEHGPNLRGVASKVSPEWLYAWIKDPSAYWGETRMPDLRLSDQDAADIVAYMVEDPEGIFTDVPAGWEESPASYDVEVLREQARWFFNRTARDELEARFEGEWSDDRALLRAVGEKLVLNQGCHSCHEIAGLESAMPIGTELTTWASKTVDKLDWGFQHQIIAEQRGWDYRKQQEFKEYREGWLEQKLHAPRSFDAGKRKNPNEKLRMPWFGFSPEEVEAVSVFVNGLVEDEVQRARMIPSAEEASMDHGLRVIRQQNCAACHQIEPGEIEFVDQGGVAHRAKGRFPAFEDRVFPPHTEGIQDYIELYTSQRRVDDDDPEYEVEDVVVQLLEPVPGVEDAGGIVVVEDVGSVRGHAAWGGDFVDVVTDYYLNPWGWDPETEEELSLTGDPDGEGRVQDVDGEWRSFFDEPYDKVRWTYAPPVLWNEGAKVQRDWFYSFLLDPLPLRRQMRVKMPTFNWSAGEAGAVADYFAVQAARSWPERFAKRMLYELDTTPAEVARTLAEMGVPGASESQVQDIVRSDSIAIEAGLSKLLAYAEEKGFAMAGPVHPSHQAIEPRSPSTLNAVLATQPDFYDRVYELLLEGPNCFQCHFLRGEEPTAEGPIAWAPDLDLTRQRLLPDWVRPWLTDPSKIYPGTAMPANFPLDQEVWQDLYPHPSEAQIEAVLTWLFNLDRARLGN